MKARGMNFKGAVQQIQCFKNLQYVTFRFGPTAETLVAFLRDTLTSCCENSRTPNLSLDVVLPTEMHV